MFKKFIFALIFLGAAFMFASNGFAADWSQYVSGRNNIRLDGYDGQPGYIEFTDGDGTSTGLMWIDSSNRLRFCSPGAQSLTTAELDENQGLIVSTTNP